MNWHQLPIEETLAFVTCICTNKMNTLYQEVVSAQYINSKPTIKPFIIKKIHMENENFLEKVANQLGQSASVKNVYGTPVIVGNKTIIPVSRIALGFGGGYGQGNKPKNKATDP